MFEGSLLDKAGIKQGDMIYAVNNHPVDMYGEISATWCEDKISLVDYVSFIPMGSEVDVTVYRYGAKKDFKFDFEQSKLPAIRTMYPDYEKIDYEVIGGMVIMQLSRNLIPHIIQSAPELIRYEEPKNQIEPILVVTHVLPDSPAQRARIVAPGTRIVELNGTAVKTLDEFRQALKKSISSEYLTFKSFNQVFAAFNFKDILKCEERLSRIYRYPISETIQNLMKETLGKVETGSASVAQVATS